MGRVEPLVPMGYEDSSCHLCLHLPANTPLAMGRPPSQGSGDHRREDQTPLRPQSHDAALELRSRPGASPSEGETLAPSPADGAAQHLAGEVHGPVLSHLRRDVADCSGRPARARQPSAASACSYWYSRSEKVLSMHVTTVALGLIFSYQILKYEGCSR
jgi:hypothetical protein